tara:strand:- start:6172 stop:6498 length:327 start_codon:yes stop_codon:yes gene_type:complete
MSSNLYDFREGDTLSVLRTTALDDVTKEIIPLSTLFTATLVFQIGAGPTISQPMSVLSGVDDGVAEYQFGAGELTPGTMTAQVVLTQISTARTSTNTNEIIKQVGPSL